MLRLKQVLMWLMVAFAALLAIDYMLVRAKEKHAAPTVSQANGRMGSLPGWPIGSEYRVTFDRPLAQRDLSQLTILNTLRGSVVVAFVDCQLTNEQIAEVVNALPHCLVVQVTDGQTRLLGR